jgi:hypothetical protein
MNHSSEEHSWKVFQRDTEAGRLLSRLYGCTPSQSRVSYPSAKQRRRSTEEKQPNENPSKWKTTYTVHTLNKTEEREKENERKNNITRALLMKVPKFGQNVQRRTIDGAYAKVDQIPRRKNVTGCINSVEEAKFLNKKYRPPAAHAFSSEGEKQRLSDMFSRGKDLTGLGNSNGDSSAIERSTTSKQSSMPKSLFDQIFQEIKERREHQLEMERLGAGESTRQTTVNEIQSRLHQLRRIDPSKAADVIKMLLN